MKIAQRFIAGNVRLSTESPVGTTDSNDGAGFSRPYGTHLVLTAKPSDESLGYFQLSRWGIFKSVPASDAEHKKRRSDCSLRRISFAVCQPMVSQLADHC